MSSFSDTLPNQEEQTEFNAAVAALMRIDGIKKKMILDTLKEDYLELYKSLTAFYKELVSILTDKEETEQGNNFIQHKKNYRELKSLMNKNKSSVPLRLIDWLDFWEIELKNLEQQHGMLLPKKGDPRFALAGRR